MNDYYSDNDISLKIYLKCYETTGKETIILILLKHKYLCDMKTHIVIHFNC